MISVYAVIKTRGGSTATGVWKGPESTAPEDCIEVEGRNGKVETHYWIVSGDNLPKKGQKCICKKEKYGDK